LLWINNNFTSGAIICCHHDIAIICYHHLPEYLISPPEEKFEDTKGVIRGIFCLGVVWSEILFYLFEFILLPFAPFVMDKMRLLF
jgi:hypothetical protein